MRIRNVCFVVGLAVLSPSVTSCGGGAATPAESIQAGSTALGKSDWKAALASFDAALAQLPSTDPSFKRAKMGQIEALIHVDAARAKTEFLTLAGGASSQVDSKDWRSVMSKLTGERAFSEAIGVLEAGLKQHPEDLDIKKMGEAIKVAAEKAGDSNALGALQGLGYL